MDSEKWAGFTAEDLEKFKTNKLDSALCDTKCLYSGPMEIIETAKNVQQAEFPSKSMEMKDANFRSEHPDKVQQFSGTWKIKGTDTKYSASVESLNGCTCENSNCENYASDESSDFNNISNHEDKISSQSSERSSSSNTEMQDLEIFESRQKRIEAENAKRRALINKAIMDKKKRTQAEASKLTQITDELKRLDSMLSADVSILRDYIEKASMEFSDAEKRYLRAEKELIEAKFLLFEKMQRKEQLTEHLCAIIEQNENRKANKLVELMKQLEMEAIIEDFEVPDAQPILSKYCVMNDEAYHCCQTLKPLSPTSPLPDSEQQDQISSSEHLAPDTNSKPVENDSS